MYCRMGINGTVILIRVSDPCPCFPEKYIFIYKIEFLIKCLRIQYLSHFFILYIKTITYAKYAKK